MSFSHHPLKDLTKRSRALGYFIGEIKRNTAHDPVVVKDNIESFNALAMPRFYVCVSDDLVHIVKLVSDELSSNVPPLQVSYAADVIWYFNYMTGIWNVIKDRTGIFESLCPMKCGGEIKSLSVPVQS